MGRASNQMVTYADLDYMIANEGFALKNPFASNGLAPTKADIQYCLQLDESAAEWISWGSNRLVPYRLLIPGAVTYVGVGAVCEDGAVVDNPPTAPTIVEGSKTSTSILVSWTASPGTDDNGIVEYRIEKSLNGTTWEAEISTSQTTYEYFGLPSNTLHYFRVRAIDGAVPPQSSPYSNTLQVTTETATTSTIIELKVVDQNDASDHNKIYVKGPSGDTVTYTLTVNSGTTGSCTKKWKWWRLDKDTFNIRNIDGADLPTLPQQVPGTGSVTFNGSWHEIAYGNAYRGGGQTGYEATTQATLTIETATGGLSIPSPIVATVNATGPTTGC